MFKKGDIIVRIVDPYTWINVTLGKSYEVMEDMTNSDHVLIVDDNGHKLLHTASNFVLDKNTIVTNILKDL